MRQEQINRMARILDAWCEEHGRKARCAEDMRSDAILEGWPEEQVRWLTRFCDIWDRYID